MLEIGAEEVLMHFSLLYHISLISVSERRLDIDRNTVLKS